MSSLAPAAVQFMLGCQPFVLLAQGVCVCGNTHTPFFFLDKWSRKYRTVKVL